mmetsp:Transcript_21609/g.44169  ORF Transcript_21609/g.44169 Transcript_21609/m.44169 type:complete len:236 (+) Transcript_21609:46-753(+)
MMMSAPKSFCATTLDSGVSSMTCPSWYERNTAPCSLTRSSEALPPSRAVRVFDFDFISGPSSLLGSASEKTWKPPLSVMMGPACPMKRCSPPARRTMSGPGCTSRWYVLQNMSCVPASTDCRSSIALRAALVPTGTKAGVSMTPCGVVIRPTRAREPGLRERCTTSKLKNCRASHAGKVSAIGGSAIGSTGGAAAGLTSGTCLARLRLALSRSSPSCGSRRLFGLARYSSPATRL